MVPKNTLVTFVHFNRPNNPLYKENLEFFLSSGLIDSDRHHFNFVINSETEGVEIPQKSNVSKIKGSNKGYDFGAYSESIKSVNLNKFDSFIFINDTCRGPFLPNYIPKSMAWTDLFLHEINEEVKMVGPTWFTLKSDPWLQGGIGIPKGENDHIQSWCFGVDKNALNILLENNMFNSYKKHKEKVIIDHEIGCSQTLIKHGFKIKPFQISRSSNKENGDINHEGNYFGITANPLELMFFKTIGSNTQNLITPKILNKYTEWSTMEKQKGVFTLRKTPNTKKTKQRTTTKNTNKKLNLKKIDLIAVDGNKGAERLNTLLKIAEYSLSVADFNSVKIFTGCKATTSYPHPSIELLHTNVNSSEEYNKFILRDLASHVDGTHCLIFQHDGFIINPSMWTDDFLDCDYIGAPWPKSMEKYKKMPQMMVGNGGFSLRTKKIIEAYKHIIPDFKANEDWLTCVRKYKRLKDMGIKFADRELAAKFSLELDNEINSDITKVFGFHGNVARKDIGPRSKKMKEIIKSFDVNEKNISDIYLSECRNNN